MPLEQVVNKDYWGAMLHEKPRKTAERFMKEGMIERVALLLPERVALRFTVKELKEILKSKNLKASGSKSDLIQCLTQNAPVEMDKATSTIERYQCTAEGRRIAEQYLAEEQEKREVIGDRVFELVSRRDFDGAVDALEEYKKRNPSLFPASEFALKYPGKKH